MDSEDLKLLLMLDDRGSMSAVAKQLDLAVSTVARRLEGLEASLGLRLLDRRANGVRLTSEGGRIAALAAPLVDQAARIARAAAALGASSAAGNVTISATDLIVTDVLAPALPQLWQASPGLSVTLRAQGEVVSLAAREADIALRMSRPEGASLIARRVYEIELGCFASADYLAGRDPSAISLENERLLVYDDSYGRIAELDWVTRAGLDGAVALRTGSTRALLNAAAAGGGVALLPVQFANAAGLVRLTLPFQVPSRPVWLLTHRDVRRLPAIRAAHRWIAGAFAALAQA
jgi:DNA-binding transcriptional LysR family regulator